MNTKAHLLTIGTSVLVTLAVVTGLYAGMQKYHPVSNGSISNFYVYNPNGLTTATSAAGFNKVLKAQAVTPTATPSPTLILRRLPLKSMVK